MKEICFLFPGQGCQKINMGVELYSLGDKTKEVFETASEVFGQDVLKLSEDEKALKNTKFAQIAIVATSIAAFCILTKKNIYPNFLVGHSLGQYSCLFASGMLSLKDTFWLVKKRAESMELCCKNQNGAMCAIIGATKEQIENELKKVEGYVVTANFNSPSQIVISGEKNAVEKAAFAIKKFAKKIVVLNTAGAFHSNLMTNAAKIFEKDVEKINFLNPKINILSNVTGEIIKNSSLIRKLLIDQITSPVLFWKEIENLNNMGVKIFVEVGPKKTLTNLIKQHIKDVTVYNVEDKKSLEKTIYGLSNN